MDQTETRTPSARARRRPLPDGAAKWSMLYVDGRGVHQSPFPVPVDENDMRTDHIRVSCTKVALCPRDAWIKAGDPVRYCPDHGAALSSEHTGRRSVLPWSAMWRTVEAPMRPAWVLAAEAAAGLGLYEGESTPLAAIVGGSVATASAYAYTRIFLTRRAVRRGNIERGQTTGRHVDTIRRRTRTAAYIGTIGTAWLTAATSVDPESLLGRVVWASLPIAWAVSAAPWWRYLEAGRRRAVPADVAAVAEQVAPTDDAIAAAEAAQTWAEHVGFPHTRLDVATWKRTVAGWQAVVVAGKKGALVAVTGDADSVKKSIHKIAAGYGVKRSAVTWIAEHDDDPNQALLLIQPNNPLKVPQVWEGPDSIDMERGVAVSGRYVDGTPMVEVLYRKDWGAPNRVTLGTTGGGKSERVRKRLIIERWAHFTDPETGEKRGAFISILHDPKEMDSYGEFMPALAAYGTTRDEGHMIVDALLREMDRRYGFKKTIKWTDRRHRERYGSLPWDPAIHGPIISSTWDEFHELAADKEFVGKITRLARKQRACGMTFEVLSHGGTIGDMGSQVLRDLAGGITTLYRTKNALNLALTAGGIQVGDPRTLPTEPGMCFVVDGETQASMMARGSWIPNDENTHDVTLYDYLFDEHNQPIGYPAEIPPETADAFGKDFMEWAAAGRRPGGRETTTTPGAAFMSVVPGAADMNAEAALRRILFAADKPLTRGEITSHQLWRFGVSTLTNVFRRGQDAVPPWLVRIAKGNGVWELSPAAREEMTATADEEREDLAA